MTWSPGMVTYGADETVYLVVDSFLVVAVYREAEIARTDLESVIADLMTGRFNAPVRVVAFNTVEHWADDVSRQIGQEIQARCDSAGEQVPEHIRDFEEHRDETHQQLTLGFRS
jgi:hypothetical protein